MKSNCHYKFQLFGIALALSASASQAFAIGTANDIDQSANKTAFSVLDTDKNGTLTKAEAYKERIFVRHFAAADKNHDGTLDLQEYTDYRTQAQQKNVKRITKDSVITSKVKGSMLKDEGMKSLNVSVETQQGIVILSGFVETQDQIQQAGKIAAATDGVKSVKNSLVLKKE